MYRSRRISNALLAIAFAAALAGSACGGDSIQTRLDKASDGLAAGEYRSAEIQLKNVLQKQPENGQAWFLLGRVSAATSQYPDAVEQFRRAREHGTAADEVDVPLAHALLATGAFKDVLSLLVPEDVDDTAIRASMYSLRGEAYLGLTQFDASSAAFERALSEQAEFPAAVVGKAKLAAAQGEGAEAARLLKTVLASNPDYFPALEARSRLAYDNNDCGQAAPVLERILALPDTAVTTVERFVARSYLADCQMRQGQYADAKGNIAKLMKAGPQSLFANYLQSLVDIRNKDYGQATVHLQRVLKVAPTNTKALTLMASVKIAQGDPRLAELYLNEVLSRTSANIVAIRMLASLYIRQDESDKAVSLLQKAVADNADAPPLRAMLAEALVRSGDSATALEYMKERVNDEDPNLQMNVANAMTQTGDADAALALLDRVKGKTDNDRFKAQVLRISAYLQKKQTEKAVAAAKAMLDEQPHDARRLRLLASTYLASGQMDKAQSSLEQALSAQPDSIQTRLDLGLIGLRTRQYEAADEQFEAVLQQQPDNLAAMLGLAQTAGLRGDATVAIKWLKKAQGVYPDRSAIGVALTRAYFASGQHDKAKAQADELVRDYPTDAALRRLHGAMLLAIGQKKAGVQSLEQAVQMAPERPTYRLDLARAQIATGDVDSAVKQLDIIRKKFPDFVPGASTLALAQLKQGHPAIAMATADSLVASREGQVAADTVKGDILHLQGQYAAAADAYARAYARKPSRALAVSLFHSRQRAGGPKTADSLVDWLAQHPQDIVLGHMLGEWYQASDKLPEAADAYRKILDIKNDDVTALNNLALIYARQNDDRALPTAERAYGLNKRNPAVVDTMGWIAWQQGQHERALPLIRQAAEAAPGVAEIQYHLAAALAASQDAAAKKRARAILAQLLSKNPSFTGRDKAEQLSRQLERQGPAAANG